MSLIPDCVSALEVKGRSNGEKTSDKLSGPAPSKSLGHYCHCCCHQGHCLQNLVCRVGHLTGWIPRWDSSFRNTGCVALHVTNFNLLHIFLDDETGAQKWNDLLRIKQPVSGRGGTKGFLASWFVLFKLSSCWLRFRHKGKEIVPVCLETFCKTGHGLRDRSLGIKIQNYHALKYKLIIMCCIWILLSGQL